MFKISRNSSALIFSSLAKNDTTFVSLEGFLDSTNAVQLLLEQKYSSLSPYMNYEDQFVDSTVFIYTNLNVNESEYNLLTTGNKNIYYPEI